MNGAITNQDLETLISHLGKPAISIYLPTTRIPTRVQAESLQFRNLLRDAEELMQQFDLRGPEIRAILEPARELVADSDFWRHQKDGLAVFLAENIFLRYQLPVSFETGLFVGEAFHLKPLMPLLTDEFVFYILAVSQNNVRLLRATRDSVQEVEPAAIPNSLQEVLDDYVIEKQVQFHTSTATPGTGRRGAVFFGQGAGEGENEKAKIREFFGRIDSGLRDYFQDQTAPLVFAGVDYLFPIYQEANNYPNLVESSITGNPDELPAEELQRQAWQLIEPMLLAKRSAEIERYHSSAPHGLATTDLKELVPWADKGRVDTLFVDKRAKVWGVYDAEKFEAIVENGNTLQNRDLSDLAALYTLLRGGVVYLLTPEEMEMEFGAQNRHRSSDNVPQNAEEEPVVAGVYRFAV